MATVIQFPLDRRISQMLNELPDFELIDKSILDMHLDVINDLVLDESNEMDAQRALRSYCQVNDLDPDGYKLHWAFEATVVTIAEGLF